MTIVAATLAVDNILDRDGTSFTATNTIATLPADNLAQPDVSRPMVCSATSSTIDIDAGSSVPFRQLGLFGLGESITALAITVTASTVSQSGTDVLNFSSASPGAGQSYQFSADLRQALMDFGTLSARYWRIAITATGANLSMGRLFLAPILAPTAVNIGYPFGIRTVPRDIAKEMQGGQKRVFRRSPMREANVVWGTGIDEEDLYSTMLIDLDRETGLHRQVVFTLEPGEANRGINTCILGYVEDLGTNDLSGYDQRGKTIRIRESG